AQRYDMTPPVQRFGFSDKLGTQGAVDNISSERFRKVFARAHIVNDGAVGAGTVTVTDNGHHYVGWADIGQSFQFAKRIVHAGGVYNQPKYVGVGCEHSHSITDRAALDLYIGTLETMS